MNPPRGFSFTIVFLFGAVVLLPIFYMLLMPFRADTAEQFGELFAVFDSRHIGLAKNSLELAGGAALLSIIVGVPLASLISRTDLWGKRVIGVAYFIPVLIPPYIHAIVWTHMGPFIEHNFFFDIHSLAGAILVLTLSYFPFVTIMTIAGLKSIDRNLEEASFLSHNRFQTFYKITIPLITPHIISGAIFVFVFSVINVSVPDILRVKVYPLEIFIQFSAFYNEKAATLLSLPLIGVTFVLIALQKFYMKDRSYIQISAGIKKYSKYKLGVFNIVALIFCIAILCFSVIVPVAVLIKTAGGLDTYIRVLSTSSDQICYSVILAFCGAVLTMFLGFSLAYLIDRLKGRPMVFLSWATFLPLSIPATTLGIGLIGVWNRPVADLVYSSSIIIVLGYIARFIPYSVIVLGSGLKQVDRRLEEAAFLAGSYWSNMIRKIVIPLLRHNLFAVFFIVFVLSFGELGTTLLIIPPGRETIPIKAYNLMHYGADQMVAALCLILVTLILAISGVFLIFHKKMFRIAEIK
ncbi:MAG: iron ABC transporter permease [Proteobacteria bacterium]|nr:iron ABC transporter permease [Pseudomonadota bacterium]